jgi:hypothetical protein
VGYRKEVTGTFNQGTIVEATITETADICQLLRDGYMLMIDRVDLKNAEKGKTIHALIQNIRTGQVSSHKYYTFNEEIDDTLWIENSYSHTYETEFDYS